MTTAIQFRRPRVTVRRSPTFGLPISTFGRGIYAPEAIILHSLRISLDSYDAQATNLFIRNKAEPKHPSLHFAIDYEGNIHQYVEEADIAWGLWDYRMTNFPAPFPEGNSPVLDLHPGISPDYFSIHIGMMSGELGDHLPFSQAAMKSHARLIAWLCHTYNIDCDVDHVAKHEDVDTQFEGVCIGDVTYPYTEILAAAQVIISAGGEADPIFETPPILEEYFGPWTVGTSRVSSAAYIIS